jgi:hypothetical protein
MRGKAKRLGPRRHGSTRVQRPAPSTQSRLRHRQPRSRSSLASRYRLCRGHSTPARPWTVDENRSRHGELWQPVQRRGRSRAETLIAAGLPLVGGGRAIGDAALRPRADGALRVLMHGGRTSRRWTADGQTDRRIDRCRTDRTGYGTGMGTEGDGWTDGMRSGLTLADPICSRCVWTRRRNPAGLTDAQNMDQVV